MLPIDAIHPVRSIESGYFVFTMMPSLFCKLRCPHCYLSIAQRKDRTILSSENISLACKKLDDYYTKNKVQNKDIQFYWYGGEPTSMGVDYFNACAEAIENVLRPELGYRVRHTILSALVGVDIDLWEPVFRRWCGGSVQTSYDAAMRGASYVRSWEKTMRTCQERGISVSTISVMNSAILSVQPGDMLDYLSGFGVKETSWLPFMLNEQNSATGKYDEFAPTMNAWSDYMIDMSSSWVEKRLAGRADLPEIGQLRFVLSQKKMASFSNIAAQTMFLMPNGDFVLPNYRDGWMEYMEPFGNILKQDFESILKGEARRKYLRRQALRNGNQECLECDHAGYCVMEFWKDNRPEDDCFGGKRFIEWVINNEQRILKAIGGECEDTLY